MTQILLHVGAPKCGSSALQTHWSSDPEPSDELTLQVPDLEGSAYAYVAIIHGRLLQGSELRVAAAQENLRYLTSQPPQTIAEAGAAALTKIRSDLHEVSKRRVPIVSSEAYLGRALDFTATRLLPRLGCSAHVLAYIRPAVSWLNSAWWQWGVWSEDSLSGFIGRELENTKWSRQFLAWRAVPGVERVTCRPLPRDVLTDLMPACATSTRANGILPAHVIRALRTTPALRSPHAPNLDFAIRRWAEASSDAPWALDPEIIEWVLAETRADVEALIEILDPHDAEAVHNDPRWWNIDAFVDRQVGRAHERASADDLGRTLEILASALLNADAAQGRAAGLIPTQPHHRAPSPPTGP